MEKSKLILYQENKVDDSRPQQDTNKKYRKLDYFTSKDIQDENKEITRIFQKEALNYSFITKYLKITLIVMLSYIFISLYSSFIVPTILKYISIF